jgi:hypothetical protein
MAAFSELLHEPEWRLVAGSCLMHCNIEVRGREAPLNGKNRPDADTRDHQIFEVRTTILPPAALSSMQQ